MLDAVTAAKAKGAAPARRAAALALQRRAQWRLDFIAAENSMGFEAPQETAWGLGEAIDYARQGQIAALTAAESPAAASQGAESAPHATPPVPAASGSGPSQPSPRAQGAVTSPL